MAVGHMCNDPDLEGLPEPERPVVARALAKRPEDRWPDCRSFVDALKVLGSAGGCSVPDALPRDRRGISSGGDGAGESSALGLDPADADFIPVDSGELESPHDRIRSANPVARFWRGKAEFGSVPRIGAWFLDRMTPLGHSLRDRLRVGRTARSNAGRGAVGEAAARWHWSARLGQIPAVKALRLDRLRQIGRRAARGATVRSRWVRIGSLAALVVLGLALWDLAIWTSAAPQGPSVPSRNVAVAETASSNLHAATASGSYQTGTIQEPTLETSTVAGRTEPPVIREAPSLPEATPKTPVDTPEPEEVVPAVPTVAAKPKESTPETRVVAAKRPEVPIGKNPIVVGLKAAVTSFQQSDLIRLVSTLAVPAAHRAKVESGSIGIAPLGSSDSHAGRLPSDGSVAPGVVTPIIILPAEVKIAAGTAAKLHIRVLRPDRAKPVQLDFQGLPRGISATGLTIPAGRDSADVVLSASAQPPPGIAEVKIAFTMGSERGAAATRINVLPPPPATVAFQRGLAALYRGSCDRAIAEFTEVIRLDPNSFEARFCRGTSYSLARRSREALADHTAAIQLQPDRPDAYLERARVYLDLGEKSLALTDYTEAIRLRPDAKAYLARGSLHHEMGSYDQAVADCDRALRLRPGDSLALYLRGLTRYHSGDNPGAVADFTEVLRLDPKDADAYRARGEAYARLGKSAEAGADHETFERMSRLSAEGDTHRGEPGGRSEPPKGAVVR
jgi:Flp pilus assembly protein TadD